MDLEALVGKLLFSLFSLTVPAHPLENFASRVLNVK